MTLSHPLIRLVHMTLVEPNLKASGRFAVVEGTDPFVQAAFVHGALDDLLRADLSVLDDEWFAHYAASAEELGARVDAVLIRVAAEVDRRGHGRRDGFFSSKAWLKHYARLSGPEARARMQVVRLFELLPAWEQAALRGEVGVLQTRLMARIAANPRVHDALVVEAENLLDDAATRSYDEFERLVRAFERLADTEGAQATAAKAHEARDVRLKQLPDGSWRLSGRFGSLQGAEVNEVLAYFNEAQWEADWEEARCFAGEDDVSVNDLRRGEAQRRADALHAAVMAAAASPGDGKAPLPTLNVLMDEQTLDTTVNGAAHDPSRYREMVCRTQNGAELDLSEAASMALWARIRRVLLDGAGVVIEMGRRARLFTGSPREATMLMSDRCLWPGCDRPVRACQADHSLAWKAHGSTVPRNGGPMCGAHNRLKDRGDFSVCRRPDGTWDIRNADHDSIG
jgi:hypothetical protein